METLDDILAIILSPVPLEDEEEQIAPWTATYLHGMDTWAGNAAMYKMEPAYAGYDRVIVSAVDNPMFNAYETFIFGVNSEGECEFEPLPGSVNTVTSYTAVLTSIGYQVK